MESIDLDSTAQSNIRELIEKRKALDFLVDVTFYIPCYNEEEAIYRTLSKVRDGLRDTGITYELLIYNDGSQDRTQSEAERFAKDNPDVLVNIVTNKKRRGLGYNYISGAFVGVGKYYMMICGDDSETSETLHDILSKRGQADIIIPYFGLGDNRNFGRRNLSRLFTCIVNLINGYDIRYYNGVVLHERTNVMRHAPSSTGFGYQAELLGILLDHGKTYLQVPISNQDRTQGFSRAFHIQNIFSVTHSLLQIFLRRIRNVLWPMD